MNIFKIFSIFCILSFFGCASEPVFLNRDDQKKTDIINAKHIIFIGFDGLGSNFLLKSNMPNLKKMINEGSSSMNVYNVLPPISWPNWMSFFKGTPFDEQTGDNFPSILTIIKNADKNIAYFYEWSDMKKISDEVNIESVSIDSTLDSTLKAADCIRENKPAFTSVIYVEPDNTGHKKWYGTKSYYEKLELMDSFIPIIMQAAVDAGIYDDTVFIISSDHGGIFWEHQVNFKSIRKVPLVIFGKGIKRGLDITSTVRIHDIAPTMSVILGLEIPSEWTGIPIWEIFE